MTFSKRLLSRASVFCALLSGTTASFAACSNTGITHLTGVPTAVSIADPYGTLVPTVSFTINGVSCTINAFEDQSGSGNNGRYNADLAMMLFGAKIQGISTDVNLFASGRIDSVAYPYP